MKPSYQRLLILFLLSFPVLIIAQEQQKIPDVRYWETATLSQVRDFLVGKKVIVGGKSDEYFFWSKVEPTANGRYKELEYGDRLPKSYFSKEAEVIAVQLNEIKLKELPKSNALGEPISESSIKNPYCDVIVRFDDGTLAMTTSFSSLLLSGEQFRLSSTSKSRATLINDSLPAIIGKTAYAVGFSRLYAPDSSINDLTGTSARLKHLTQFPRLEPLTIVAAKYDEQHDVVVLKLKDQKGNEYLTASDLSDREKSQNILDRVIGGFPATLILKTVKLTPREITSIKEGSIFRGMSEYALYYTLGFPDKENDWGRGGRQLIYADGKLMIYLDASEHITDWQDLDR